jgi:DNA topoisomerase-1
MTEAPRTIKRIACPISSRATRSAAAALKATGHQTKPPARYTEATLIRELEEREIGRPSTYASILSTIQNRGYVYKKGTALVPSWLAFSAIGCWSSTSRLVSYEFTAALEAVLDEIASGQKDTKTELTEFYFGSDRVEGLKTWSPSSARSTPRRMPPSRSAAQTAGSPARRTLWPLCRRARR